MTVRELISQLECLEYDMDDRRALPAVIQTENGTMEIKSVIVRPDYVSPYCRVVELSPKESVKQDLEIETDSESSQITYMTDGRTKVYYGRNGTQVETNLPLPGGFIITIKETTNDK